MIPKLIHVILEYYLVINVVSKTLEFSLQEDNKTIMASPGPYSSLTVTVVDDNVSWYTAETYCKSEYGSFQQRGIKILKYLLNYMNHNKLIESNLIWIGLIKYIDDKFYKVTCSKPLHFPSLENLMITPGIEECVTARIYNNTGQVLSLHDCMSHYPYMCIKCGDQVDRMVNIENTTIIPKFPENVKISSQLTTLNDINACVNGCRTKFRCIGAMFLHDNLSCVFVLDKTGNIEIDHTLFVIKSDENITSIVKEDGRKNVVIQKSNQAFNYSESKSFSCFDTTSTETSITTQGFDTTSTETNINPELLSTTDPNKHCNCSCSRDVLVWNTEDGILKPIDKQTLSSYRRLKTCAEDPRWSSKAMGLVAGLVLVIFTLIIGLLDIFKYGNICLNNTTLKTRKYEVTSDNDLSHP